MAFCRDLLFYAIKQNACLIDLDKLRDQRDHCSFSFLIDQNKNCLQKSLHCALNLVILDTYLLNAKKGSSSPLQESKIVKENTC